MTCLEALEYISRAVEGDLNAEEMKQLEKHIEECDSCRREYEDMQAIYKDIKNEQQYELPSAFHEDLMRKINESKVAAFKAPAKKNNFKKYAAIAASFLVLAAVGVNSGSLLLTGSSGASTEMALPSASADMAAGETEAMEEETAEAPMMAKATAENTKAEASVEEYGVEIEEGEASASKEVMDEAAALETGGTEGLAYTGNMTNCIAVVCKDRDAFAEEITAFSEEMGLTVTIEENVITVSGEGNFADKVKDLISKISEIVSDDSVEDIEYNSIEIEVK